MARTAERRGRRHGSACRALVCALWLSATASLSPAVAGEPAPVRIDHHMHVHAPAIRGFLPDYCASPGRRTPCDPAFVDPPTLDALRTAMDAAGIRHGLLMSTGYLAESPMTVPPRADAAALLRAANDFTVAVARAEPERFSAFIGINPLTATALDEIARWRGDPGVAGIKLHLTNSGVDLRDPAQVRSLAGVFRAAAQARLAIMVHLRTRAPDYGARDVEIFVSQVLPMAAGVPVQIAHAAGWGRTDANTFSALEAFAQALEDVPARGERLYFDLAAVHGAATPAADLERLAALVRRIGPAHFVAASDWPFAVDLAGLYARDYPALPLSADEWDTIRRNTFLDPSRLAPTR